MFEREEGCWRHTEYGDHAPMGMVSIQEVGRQCYIPYHHVTLEHTTCLLVCPSYPDTTRMHPVTHRMSGLLQKDLGI